VERTLAAWLLAYKDRTGQDPPVDLAREVRAKVERIAQRRDRRLGERGWG
jgi:hypothetical protein